MLLTLVMVFGVFASIPFTASAATSGDYEYEVLNEKYVEIVGYRGAKSNIVIPFHIYIFLKLKNIKIVVDINNDYMIL